ncbi:type II toxin-antitoxin system VapC family toxin [Jiella sonneratiae]|uniref:Ribonuclease VapC n=1 Tax=Jiella sonneratiae TaxID=2816856 RepID=A0ABS3J2H4_9HYPH|nr:type II toxin-antitoxin system VapC family toxin [Jiella sonneratiae]MBO0902786.1 type II toxin-antitoxin system VapC family toxin [Jiella sonneratiae]
MLLDASAIVALLAREAGADEIRQRLSEAVSPLYVCSITIFEATLALARAKTRVRQTGRSRPTQADIRRALRVVLAFLDANEIREKAVDAAIVAEAVEAAAVYGKAVGHAADLNFGDCMVYAAAKALDVPLLYIGNDFAKTDLA